MRNKIRLIALDLDETTLRRDKSLSLPVRTAIENAIAAGIYVVVASGRAFDSLPREILEIPGIDYAVTSNGAAIYRVPEKRRCHDFLMKQETAEQILKLIPNSLMMEAFVEGIPYAQTEYVENPLAFGATKRGVAYVQATRRPVKNIREFILQHRAQLDSLDIILKDDDQMKYYWKLLEQEVPDIYITSSVPQLLEISHTEGGKRCGLEWLGRQLRIAPEEMAAFGDAENDRDMIRFVGLGIAMGNGSDKLKAVADAVTLSNEEDGVAIMIEKILREREGEK